MGRPRRYARGNRLIPVVAPAALGWRRGFDAAETGATCLARTWPRRPGHGQPSARHRLHHPAPSPSLPRRARQARSQLPGRAIGRRRRESAGRHAGAAMVAIPAAADGTCRGRAEQDWEQSRTLSSPCQDTALGVKWHETMRRLSQPRGLHFCSGRTNRALASRAGAARAHTGRRKGQEYLIIFFFLDSLRRVRVMWSRWQPRPTSQVFLPSPPRGLVRASPAGSAAPCAARSRAARPSRLP